MAKKQERDDLKIYLIQVKSAGALARSQAMTSSGLSAEQHRALTLLASSPHGANEDLLVHGHGFSRDVLASLVRRGFAAAEREVVMAGGKAIEVVRLRITAPGRRAVES